MTWGEYSRELSDLKAQVDRAVASLGAIRQDLGSIKAILGVSEGFVPQEGREEPSNEALRQYLEDWRKKADEKWEALLAERRGKKGLATGDEVTPEDEEDYQEGWAR